jgi:Fe-S cluster assembly scaffold protein SufB
MKEPKLFKDPLPKSRYHCDPIRIAGAQSFFLEVREPGRSQISVKLDANAEAEIVILQNTSADAESEIQVLTQMNEGSKLNLCFVHFGGRKSHFEIGTELLGQNSQLTMQGLAYAKQDQKFSIHASNQHKTSHTQSDLQVWCVAQDQSQTIFNGLIEIESTAPKTEAYQKNRSLILGDRAVVDSFPKLLIANDDVKCAHGSSVSTLDPDQYYYLQSRGIKKEEAEVMLVDGFVRQAIARVQTESSRVRLETLLQVQEEPL